MKLPTLDPDFQLVIPTHQRTDLRSQKTWRRLPRELKEKTLIITSTKEDMRVLRKLLKHDHVYAVNDPSIDGISKKRQWIIENVRSDFVFQLDDDLTFLHRCSKRFRYFDKEAKSWKIRDKYRDSHMLIENAKFTEEHQLKSWYSFFNRIADEGFAHGGLGCRMANNTQEDEIKIVGRSMQAIFHHRKTLLRKGIRFDAVRFREDFHVTLSLLRLGYPNIIHNAFIFNASDFGKGGGCSDERTLEASNKEAYRLAKRHAPFVKTVERKYSHVAQRTEVVCSWQKAYESANKKDRRV